MGSRIRTIVPLAGACLLLAAWSAASAHAYVYWTVNGTAGFGGGGTTIGRANLDGSGVTHGLVTGLSSPSAMAVDSGYLYWYEPDTGSIARAAVDGGDLDESWIQSGQVDGLAIDGDYIYWTDSSANTIGRANLDGTDVNPAFIKISGATEPLGIAIDIESSTIYFTAAGSIWSVPMTGGTTAATDRLAVSGTSALPSLTITGGSLYFTDDTSNGGLIGSVVIGVWDMPNDSYLTGLFDPQSITTDGTYLYWADRGEAADQIGRAKIGGAGPIDIEDGFISEPGGPAGVAVDAGIDPTTTRVSCVQSTVSVSAITACSAQVTDSASSSPPSGTISFSGNAGTVPIGNPCTLAAVAGVETCTVGIEPTVAGNDTITATYSGDAVHQGSSGTADLCAGSATQCGSSSPPPGATRCVVPKLKGKSLAKARSLLAKAHCALGKVTRPKVAKGHKQPPLVVGSTRPAAGTKLADGAKIALRLVVKPKVPKRK